MLKEIALNKTNINKIIKMTALFAMVLQLFAFSNNYTDGMNYYYKYTPKNNEKAIECFEKALKNNEDTALSHAALTCALLKRPSKDVLDRKRTLILAKEHSRAALYVDNNFPEGLKAAGNYYTAMGDRESAKSKYEKALLLKPGYVDCIINLALCESQNGDQVKAEEYFKKALEIYRDNLPAQRFYGYFLLQSSSREATGVKMFKDILKQSPDDFASLLYL
jgi:Tfp pilus assembly protein PilF